MCFLQRDGVCVEDGSLLSAGREFEWAEQKRIQMVSVLRGFRGTKHKHFTVIKIHAKYSNTSILINPCL